MIVAKYEYKTFKTPDEVRKFEKGKLELANLDKGAIGRFTLEPGWRWSKHVKPIAGTEWCEVAHFNYMISGRMHVKMVDGAEFEVGPGDVVTLEPGHDAWVVGDDPVVALDWIGAANYAKRTSRPI
ncbi:MAG: cupin domain-containing protein [Chloroflexi bacterium]|nr:cupin domain-containing protein [Chloroflexota bacterium]